MTFDDISVYLPKYLSSASEKELYDSIIGFPNIGNGTFFTTKLKDSEIIYQGDGIKDMLIVNIPEPDMRKVPCMILSNTCDSDVSNQRQFSARIVYAPIFNLAKYRLSLEKRGKSEEVIRGHFEAIRKQRITQIMYIPPINGLLEESLVFLDRTNNCRIDLIDRTQLQDRRIFTLSDFGSYLFMMKLSIHFTRIQDKVDRGFIAIDDDVEESEKPIIN